MSGLLTGRTVLIADDHRLFAEGVALILREEGCSTIIVTEHDQILTTLSAMTPHLLVLDLAFGDESAMPLLLQIRQERRHLPILVISASEESVIVERVRDTGAAYLGKSEAGANVATVIAAIFAGTYAPPKTPARRSVSKTTQKIGTVNLNRLHVDVLRLVRQGRSNPEIAKHIGRAIKTVESHISILYARTGVANRAQLIRWANEHAKELHEPESGT
ncbi:MAG: response regulator transcription factor [Gemmatimonadales bacterium]